MKLSKCSFFFSTIFLFAVATHKPCSAELWPSLETYVRRCVLIVKAKAIAAENGRLTFHVLETWKGRYSPDDFVETTTDARFFASRLGSGGNIKADQEIVLFFTWRNQRIKGKFSTCSTSFPIRNGKIIYGATGDPPQFPVEFTVDQFKKRISSLREKRQIPVIVHGYIKPVVQKAEPIPMRVFVFNNLRSSIYHETFSRKPNAWNGETVNITLVDIYRNDQPINLYYKRPNVNTPVDISGMARLPIEPGEQILIETDARKWQLRDGWLPGRYKVTMRVDNLTVDKYTKLSIISDPIEFEIKEAL
jgi:hypothetical protein